MSPGSHLSKLTFQGTADDAENVLTVVSATMITTIGLVFSLTVVALQVASSQFSVRLLRTFLRDVPNQAVLATFVCTFAYATGGLYTVGHHRDAEFVPSVAVSGSLLLMFASTGALVFFLHHLMHSIQIDSVLENTQQRTLTLVDELFPEPDTPDRVREKQPAPPAGASVLLAPRSGYVQTVRVSRIADQAAESGHTVLLVTSVGDYVTAGGILGWCWHRGDPPGPADPAVVQRIMRHGHIGFERTLQQDPRFGLRQMVDIALRALSSATNDPYTAIQVVHHLSAVETVLASRALRDDIRRDASGKCWCGWCIRASRRTCTSDACKSVATGCRNRWCSRRCCRCWLVVANCVSAERRAAVKAQIDLVVRASQDLSEPSDRTMVAGAAARAIDVVEHPGTLPPPPSAFGMWHPSKLLWPVAMAANDIQVCQKDNMTKTGEVRRGSLVFDVTSRAARR